MRGQALTVAQLIAYLQKCPHPHAAVGVQLGDDEVHPLRAVEWYPDFPGVFLAAE